MLNFGGLILWLPMYFSTLYFLSNKNRVTELDRHRSPIALTGYMIWGRLINHLFIYKDKENTTYPVWWSQTLNKIAYGEKKSSSILGKLPYSLNGGFLFPFFFPKRTWPQLSILFFLLDYK